jgi:hypothetical protein
MNDDWLNKRIVIIKDMENIPKGSIGTVTGDLPEHGFAVWFDEGCTELNPPWVNFDYTSKEEYFKVIE